MERLILHGYFSKSKAFPGSSDWGEILFVLYKQEKIKLQAGILQVILDTIVFVCLLAT